MNKRIMIILLTLVAAGTATLSWFYILGQGGRERQRKIDTAVALTGGDPAVGYEVIMAFGCGACHEISGVSTARGKIGPSLEGMKDRAMVAGVMSNSAANLICWIREPREINPKTAMPDLNLSEQQARDVAAYLYSEK